MTLSLAELLLGQMEKVRGLIVEYESMPDNDGYLAAAFMRQSLKSAESAFVESDTLAIIAASRDLERYIGDPKVEYDPFAG